MITLWVNGKKVKCPTCYEELITGTYQRILKEWGVDEPDVAKRDFLQLFSILTNTTFSVLHQTSHNEQTIWNAIRWYFEQPFKVSDKLPKFLEINGRIIEIPKRVGDLSFGQNVQLRQLLDKSKLLEENISAAVAVYLQPLYDNKKFDYDKAMKLEETISQMPIHLTYPVGFFLLKAVMRDGWKPTNKWRRLQTSLKQSLIRMWPQWLRSINSASSMTYHS